MAALIGEWPSSVRALADALAAELDGWFEPLGAVADPRPLHHPNALAFYELGPVVERALREENQHAP